MTAEQTLTDPERRRIHDLVGQLGSPLAADREEALTALADFSHHPDIRKVFRVVAESDANPDVRYHARMVFSRVSTYFTGTPPPEVIQFVRGFQQTRTCDAAAFSKLMAADDAAARLASVMTVMKVDGGAEMPSGQDGQTGTNGSVGLVAMLEPYLKTEADPWVLSALIAAIGRFGGKQQVELLAEFLKHPSSRVVATAISSLYCLAPDDAFSLASRLLYHEDHRVKGNVLMVLCAKEPARCKSIVRHMALSRLQSYRDSALYCLRLFDTEFIQEVTMEMFAQEDVALLLKKEADLLAAKAGGDIVDTLVELATHKPQLGEMIQSIVKRLAERLNWSIEEFARQTQRFAGRPMAAEATGGAAQSEAATTSALPSGEIPVAPAKEPCWAAPQPAGAGAVDAGVASPADTTPSSSRIQELRARLASKLAVERDNALSELADMADSHEAREIIREAAEKDPDPDVRFHARQFYGRIGTIFRPASADEGITEFIRSYRAAGKADLGKLRELLSADDIGTRFRTLVATMQVVDKGLADALLPFLETEKDPWVLASLLTSIGFHGRKEHLARITPYFQSKSPRVVANAVSAAYGLCPDDAFDLAVPLLAHADNRVQTNVLDILRDRDLERCIGHLRLMARSRRESYRASCLYCLKKLDAKVAEEIALDMLTREDVGELVTKEADILADRGSDVAVEALPRLAGANPEREQTIRAILQRMAARLNWPPETLNGYLSRIHDSQNLGDYQRGRTQRIPIGKDGMPLFQEQLPKRRVPWVPLGAGAFVVVLAIVAVGWRSPATAKMAAASSARGNASRHHELAAPVPTGAAQWLTGTVASTNQNSVLIKSGYVYYYFEFPDRRSILPVQQGDKVRVEGKYLEWDKEAGVVRMSGLGMTQEKGKHAGS